MADERDNAAGGLSPELTVAIAWMALGYREGAALSEIAPDVARAALQLQSLTREGSLPMRALSCVRIRCRVTSVELEESSTRFVVTYVAANSEDGTPERVRTDRTDGPAGAAVRRMWQDLSGHEAVILKHTERATKAAPQGFRISPVAFDLGPARGGEAR